MVTHKKSLLDAFTASAPEGRGAVKRKSVAPPAAGGPFAPVTTDGARRSMQLGEAPRRSLLARAVRDRTVQLATLGALVALGAAYWFQRPAEAGDASSGAEVALQAGVAPGAFARTPTSATSVETPAAAAPTAADVARTNREAAQLGTAEDQAFHDPKNLCTVRVAQYKNDENGLKLARSTVAWLRKEGYPAVQPIRTGDGKALIVCVGAKPKAKDLETLVEFVHGLRGPPPQPKQSPFRDAYVVNIDDVLKRR